MEAVVSAGGAGKFNLPCTLVSELCLMYWIFLNKTVAPNRKTIIAIIEPRSTINQVCVMISSE